MPDLVTTVAAVTTFLSTYQILIVAGVILAAGGALVKRMTSVAK